ncbi:MAG: LysR family transcriptional regulator substrate-binding protein, partial [Burkholderiales bacterium]|nr:LysR family transcriptional regulator substrate-binding protein [Burkholderiales bacterium]
VEELPADDIGLRLRSGDLDLGIAYRPSGPTELSFEPLYNEEMVLVVAATHPLAGRRRIRMVELHQQPLVLLPARFTTRGMLDECFAASGAEPAVVAEMSSVAPMIGLVLRAPVGTIVSANAVPPELAGLRTVPIESPTPIRTPGLLWRADAAKTPALQSFAVIVRKTALRLQAGLRRP